MSLVAAAGASVVWSSGARAQLLDQFTNRNVSGVAVEPDVTVESRLRTDYDPLGVRVGNFLIRPDVSVRAGYDDNVLGSSHPKGSVLQETQATLNAASDWSRDSLRASLSLDDNEYIDQSRQSYTNWTASVGGTRDIGRDTLSYGYTHQNLNETPRDLDTPLLDHALAYRTDSARIGYSSTFNRLSIRPDVTVTLYDFDDGMANGVLYPQRYRNRTVIAPDVVFGYELAPRRTLITIVRDAFASYRRPDFGQYVRDYNDVSVLSGVDFDSGGLWRYRVLAGYEVRTFNSRAFKTIAAPVAEATVIYTPTGLTTLTGTLARRIADSADETTTGLTETAIKLGVAHEYLRNVLLRAQGEFYLDEYGRNQGSQTLYTLGGGVTWLLNRNVKLSATYDFYSRQSGSSTAIPALGALPSGAGAFGQGFGSSFNESRYLLTLGFSL